MRELDQAEIAFISGGMQAAESSGSGSATSSWWDDFVNAVRSWWDRWPCGGGSSTTRSGEPCTELTDQDISAAFYSIGGADILAGRNGTPLNSSQIQDLGQKAAEDIKTLKSKAYPDPADF